MLQPTQGEFMSHTIPNCTRVSGQSWQEPDKWLNHCCRATAVHQSYRANALHALHRAVWQACATGTRTTKPRVLAASPKLDQTCANQGCTLQTSRYTPQAKRPHMHSVHTGRPCTCLPLRKRSKQGSLTINLYMTALPRRLRHKSVMHSAVAQGLAEKRSGQHTDGAKVGKC